jgi:hypothetical protein
LREKEVDMWRAAAGDPYPELPPLLDYDRQAIKMQKDKKQTKKVLSSTISQLGTQSKKSICPLKVLSTFEKKMLIFNKETSLLVKFEGRRKSKCMKGQEDHSMSMGNRLCGHDSWCIFQ